MLWPISTNLRHDDTGRFARFSSWLHNGDKLYLQTELRGCVFTFRVKKQERNFLLSPITMALLIIATSSLIASSIGTGAIFSPPAVIINSAKKNHNIH